LSAGAGDVGADADPEDDEYDAADGDDDDDGKCATHI
jgi:hypothetical protein